MLTDKVEALKYEIDDEYRQKLKDLKQENKIKIEKEKERIRLEFIERLEKEKEKE